MSAGNARRATRCGTREALAVIPQSSGGDVTAPAATFSAAWPAARHCRSSDAPACVWLRSYLDGVTRAWMSRCFARTRWHDTVSAGEFWESAVLVCVGLPLRCGGGAFTVAASSPGEWSPSIHPAEDCGANELEGANAGCTCARSNMEPNRSARLRSPAK